MRWCQQNLHLLGRLVLGLPVLASGQSPALVPDLVLDQDPVSVLGPELVQDLVLVPGLALDLGLVSGQDPASESQ